MERVKFSRQNEPNDKKHDCFEEHGSIGFQHHSLFLKTGDFFHRTHMSSFIKKANRMIRINHYEKLLVGLYCNWSLKAKNQSPYRPQVNIEHFVMDPITPV